VLGEMTLVGPRPLPDYHLAAFDGAFRHLRQTVVPGLTGLWQVSARSDGDTDTLRQLDSAYIADRSLGLDLQILLRTVAVVLTGRGAR
jgi:lipopolysaccharide/colanic/teichoic acid biosynthesis glycosyltransferase